MSFRPLLVCPGHVPNSSISGARMAGCAGTSSSRQQKVRIRGNFQVSNSFLQSPITSFKLVSNSSFKLAVKGELHFSGREILKSGTSIGIGFLNFAPGKMQFPLNSEVETGV